MAQMLVRNIEEDVAERFRNRAEAEGKTLEQALRGLIETYASSDRDASFAKLDVIRSRTRGKSVSDPVARIRHDRDSDHSHR